jgi:signal transduction histidine kinase
MEMDSSCRALETKLSGGPLSPDLRNELNTIVQDGMRGALKYISASATKFQRLIDALLALSRTGREQYRREPIDIQQLVKTTLDSLKQSVDKSGASISITKLPSATGDATAVGQVFSNLIGNSLKYLEATRPGVIEVGAENGSETPDRMLAHFWVRDNGTGIPASAKERLFQVFQRFHPDVAPGDGIGLATVKRIIERHGGQIWADSTEGVGTTFHFTLRSIDAGKG